MGDLGVVAGRRRDVDEVELVRLGREQRPVVGVDASARQVRPARARAAACGNVGDRDDLDVAGAGAPLLITGRVPLLHDEAVADQCAAKLLHVQLDH